MSVNVLVVSGSTGKQSRTRHIADVAAEAARAAGAEVRVLDLGETALPVADHSDKELMGSDVVKTVREGAAWADGFVLATPEYHGNLSGAMKNWFDYLWPELAGKLAGVIATTGGGGGDMSIVSTKSSFHWCHGFTLPFHAAASGKDFDGGTLTNDKVRVRIQRVGHDVVRYAKPIREAFEAAKAMGKEDPAAGFAGTHA